MANSRSDKPLIGGRFELGALVAIQGLEGCTDMRCTRWVNRETGEDAGCAGYHCPVCLEPTSMYPKMADGELASPPADVNTSMGA